MTRAISIMRHELRVLRRDQVAFLVLLAMPLLIMAFVRPVYGAALRTPGSLGGNGADFAVPGMAVVFSFFTVGSVGLSFYRDYSWGTWDRLRSSPATTTEIVLGKAIPLFIRVLLQQAVFFTAGVMLLGLRIRGSVVGIAAVSACLALCLIGLGIVVVAFSRSMAEINVVQSVGALLFAGIGGALTPQELLPRWASTVAPASPGYWAVGGYRQAIAESFSSAQIARDCLVLLAIGFALLTIAITRLRRRQQMEAWG